MKLKIEIVSDIVCPWCYIGKRRLEEALTQFGKRAEVDIFWKPYQLAPDLPCEGVDRKEYMQRKFGAERAKEMSEYLTEVGAADGLEFHFEKIKRAPNTLAAHRLVWLAQKEGDQNSSVENLFKSYFVSAEDIGDIKTLKRIGLESGLSQSRLEQFFSSDEGVKEVQAEIQSARDKGISMVPYFTINNAHQIRGAEAPETILSALEDALL